MNERKVKPLFNPGEAPVAEIITNVCDRYSAHMHGKSRLLEVLDIHQQDSPSDYNFCMRAHLDFVVSDSDHLPLFAVELDSSYHDDPKQISRDVRKNRLCQEYGLPLLRIRSWHLKSSYRGFNLLAYIIHCWFIEKTTLDAYLNGSSYELFDAADIFADPSLPGQSFPYQLDYEANRQINLLFRKDVIKDSGFSLWLGRREPTDWIALAAVRVGRGWRWSRTHLNLNASDFPVDYIHIVEAVAKIELLAKIENDRKRTGTGAQLRGTIEQLKKTGYAEQHVVRKFPIAAAPPADAHGRTVPQRSWAWGPRV